MRDGAIHHHRPIPRDEVIEDSYGGKLGPAGEVDGDIFTQCLGVEGLEKWLGG